MEQALFQPAVAAGPKIIRLQPFENLETKGIFAMSIPGILPARGGDAGLPRSSLADQGFCLRENPYDALLEQPVGGLTKSRNRVKTLSN
ncbi:hypothetical protein CG471_22440 [Sphingobium sp. IP1]|nr:hypothetical protein CG471_22440 [Sphingobium sp. IP1]